MQNGSKLLRTLARVLKIAVLALLLTNDASGTAALIAVSQTKILLAADGMSIHPRKGLTPDYTRSCKIRQAGDSFLIVIGLEDDPDTGLNIPQLARRAFAPAGDLLSHIGTFEKLANNQIFQTLMYIKTKDHATYSLLSASPGPPISVVISGKINGALAVAVLEYVEVNGKFKENPPQISIGSTDPKYMEVGEVSAMQAYMQNHDLRGMEDIAWFRTLLGVEIDSQPRTGLKKVGPPISILEITIIGDRWVDPGACSDGRTTIVRPKTPG
jgi:hypothetical protein